MSPPRHRGRLGGVGRSSRRCDSRLLTAAAWEAPISGARATSRASAAGSAVAMRPTNPRSASTYQGGRSGRTASMRPAEASAVGAKTRRWPPRSPFTQRGSAAMSGPGLSVGPSVEPRRRRPVAGRSSQRMRRLMTSVPSGTSASGARRRTRHCEARSPRMAISSAVRYCGRCTSGTRRCWNRSASPR